MEEQLVRIDGIKWWVSKTSNGLRLPVPLCPDHELRLTSIPPKIYSSRQHGYINDSYTNAIVLQCAEGPHELSMPRKYDLEQKYVLDRVDAKVFKDMPLINLDDEAVPIAKDKQKSKNNKYFVTSQLMNSKRGLQLVVYAGEKGTDRKAQIFIEPKVKRLAFDQKDLNPSDIFVELSATFEDGTKHTITKGNQHRA